MGIRSTSVLPIAAFIGLFCAGCQNSVRPPVDLAGARIAPGHAPLVIDGQTEWRGHEWDGAASVPFPRGGKARFLWDDKGLYGLLQVDWFMQEDESVCVSVNGYRPDCNEVKLYAAAPLGFGRSSPATQPSSPTTRPVLQFPFVLVVNARKEGQPVQYASRWHVAARAFPWSVEFFIPWSAMSEVSRPPGELYVRVYRIAGQRPYSLLRLELPPSP